MTFEGLHSRLLTHLRDRIRGGEITERRLGVLAGISQPHMHHALKGTRGLSPAAADRVLEALGIDVLDLAGVRPGLQLPVATGRLGPYQPFPSFRSASEATPFDLMFSEGCSLVAAVVCGDSVNERIYSDGDWLLLDTSEAVRSRPEPGRFYAVDYGSYGAVRRVRWDGESLWLWGACEDSSGGECISMRERNILDIIKARAVAVVRPLESFSGIAK